MKFLTLSASLLFILLTPIFAQNKFLSLEEAFFVKTEVLKDKAVITFDLADYIYVYKQQVAIDIKENDSVKAGAFTLPEGVEHDGEVVYLNGQVLNIPLVNKSSASGLAAFSLVFDFEGCSDQGLCYEPSTKVFDLEVDLSSLKRADTSAGNQPALAEKEEPLVEDKDPVTALLAGGNILYILGGFFIFGLLLSLTPCVFPMVPILSSVIVSHGSDMTTRKAFWLSMVYVQAMAITYTIAGVIAGLSGAGVQAAFQTPWVIAVFSGVFVLLALSMFGLFEIQMPQSLQSYLNRKTDGRGKGSTSIAIMGLLSALIVGPCVAAPLSAALRFMSQTGEASLGVMALYALSWGMGFLLMVVVTGRGKFIQRSVSRMGAFKCI